MRRQERIDLVGVVDISMEEFVPLSIGIGNTGEIREISRGLECIDIRDHFRPIMLEHVTYEITADKAAAAGDEESHRTFVNSQFRAG